MESKEHSLRKLWNHPRFRSWVVQLLILFLFILVTGYAFNNVWANLKRQGIASGFGFLESTAGFDIIQHLVEYSESSSYGRAFFVALLNTLLVSGLGIVFATLIGFSVGVARISNNWLVSKLATTYVELIRNIPLLLQLFFWYFAVLRTLPGPRESLQLADLVFLNNRGLYVPAPQVEGVLILFSLWGALIAFVSLLVLYARRKKTHTGAATKIWPMIVAALTLSLLSTFYSSGISLQWEIPKLAGFNFEGGWTLIPELVALTLSLSLYTAAFIAEIVRSGIESVPKGQKEAASALGLSTSQTLRLVVLPQASRVIIPPLTSQYLNLTKNSSLAAAIAYPDLILVFAGTVLMQTGQAVEVIAMTMGVYLVISLSISIVMNLYNKAVALKGGA